MRRARASSPDPFRIAFAAVGVGLVVVAGFSWSSTRLGEYSVMTMGHVVDGHGGAARPPASSHHGSAGSARAAAPGSSPSVGGVDVTSLVADPTRPADVRVQLTARRGRVSVTGGRALEGYTVNGTSPGPTIRAHQGDLVEVTFVNESVDRRGDAALARHRRPQRGGRCRGRDAGCRARRRALRVPVRREGRRHVLVPLPPDVARTGREGAVRRRGDPAGRPSRTRSAFRGGWGRGGRRGRRPSRLRGAAHPQRGGAGRPRERGARNPGARARREHRPGHRRGVGLGALPGGGDGRERGVRADRRRRAEGPRRGGRTGRPDPRRPRLRGGAGSPRRRAKPRRRAGGGGGPGPPAAAEDARPARVRRTGSARVRRRPARPGVRLRHRPSDRTDRRAARVVLDDQRPHVPRRADVPRGRG